MLTWFGCGPCCIALVMMLFDVVVVRSFVCSLASRPDGMGCDGMQGMMG